MEPLTKLAHNEILLAVIVLNRVLMCKHEPFSMMIHIKWKIKVNMKIKLEAVLIKDRLAEVILH